MTTRVLSINETLIAKLLALAALGLIVSILFGVGHPAKAASPFLQTATTSASARCSGR